MKLVEHFNAFFTDTVNLNQDRIDTLEERVETIEDFLHDSEFETTIRSFSKQGSWAHKTIIRPLGDKKEFDVDLVVYVDPVDRWTPRDYILELRRVFRNGDRYRDMTRMRKRCVTLDYAGDFHLDIVPIVVTGSFPNNGPTYSVCNRIEDEFEQTDGDGYAEWWRGQDAIAKGHLKKVTRLLKYLRDLKGTFSVQSVLLTTLTGQRITGLDALLPGSFADVPTALKTVVNRLDDWLQERSLLPEVENPALPGESFTRDWDQDVYDNFRDKMHQYREWIDDAYDEVDRDESIRKWRQVFGEEFAKGETVERATTVVAKLAASFQRGQDLVAVVVTYGGAVLDRMPRILPHVEPSPYRPANNQIPVRMIAHEKRTRGGTHVRALQNGQLIDPGSGIEFQAIQNTGLPFPKEYKVEWQVVNTDQAAAAENDLRGGFYRSDVHGYRYEATKYRGVHWVQAFLVNSRTDLRVGVSDRFFVVIA